MRGRNIVTDAAVRGELAEDLTARSLVQCVPLRADLAMASRPSTALGRSPSLPKQRPTPRAALVGDQPSRQTPTRPAVAVKGAA